MHNRAALIHRLRDLVGSRFTSAHGVEGIITWEGLVVADPRKSDFVPYESKGKDHPGMADDQLAEVLRCGERFVKHAEPRMRMPGRGECPPEGARVEFVE